MTEAISEALTLIRSVENDAPGAVRLAEAVSLAVQVEPELLRRVRLDLLPDLDAGAEADLWFSELVETQSVLAVMLVPEVAERLRERLFHNYDRAFLHQVRAILREVHQNAAPLVRLEEALTWMALSGEQEDLSWMGLSVQGGAEELIEQGVRTVLSAMVNQNRRGIAHWTIAALPRLPEAARGSAAELAFMAEKLLRGWQLNMDEPSAGTVLDWSDLPRAPIGVRLLQTVVEFGDPEADGAQIIEVPQTSNGLVFLEVSTTSPEEKPQIFISHSAKDAEAKAVLDALDDRLRAVGFEVLLDKERLQPGAMWRDDLHRWMDVCRAAVILLSNDALTSAWVMQEATILAGRRSRDQQFVVLPVLLSRVQRSDFAQGPFASLAINQIQAAHEDTPAAIAEQVVQRLAPLKQASSAPRQRQHVTRLSFHSSQTRRVPIRPGEVTIRMAPNEIYTLRPSLLRYPDVILPKQSLAGQELQLAVQLLTTPFDPAAEALFVADLNGPEQAPVVDIRLSAAGFDVQGDGVQHIDVARDQDTIASFNLAAISPGEQVIQIDIVHDTQPITTLQRRIRVLELPSFSSSGAGGTHFISYSGVDGSEFALRLADALYPTQVWLDKRQIRPGEDWDAQIVDAIRSCASLLFIMTRDSIEDASVSMNEWVSAARYKKPIILIRVDPEAEPPFRLAQRQIIDFTGDFDPALARLRYYLWWLASPEGWLQALKDRLADARRDLRRASDEVVRLRIQDDIAQLEQQIAEQQRVLDDPEGAARRTAETIERGIERERQPSRPNATVARTKFINPPPLIAPTYFQGRHVETQLIGTFLRGEALRLMTVVGRGGSGKTALVCRVLKALEAGQLPEDGGALSVDGIVYLSSVGARRVTLPNLYSDLGKLLATDVAARLDQLYKDPQVSVEAKMRALLAEFPQGRVVVLLDNFEDLIDIETYVIKDTELDQALRVLLEATPHAVKLIITSRIPLRSLALVQPSLQTRLDLDEGLPSPYAENILREMDVDGKVGLKTAPDALLAETRERTRGYPRALEALFAILSADRDTSLQEILDNAARLLPENVVEVLVGEAFSRLDPVAQQVMQALAIYGRPVAPVAVDYLLQAYAPGVDSGPVLGRLVNMQFARREARRYYLHPVDCDYALERVPRGEEADRDVTSAPPFTQYALLHRGAEFFKQARTPRESWKSLEDLAPQLNEFDLRCAGEDYDAAANVLLEIGSSLMHQPLALRVFLPDKDRQPDQKPAYLVSRGHDRLVVWGQYRLTAELHERLQGKLIDPWLQQWNIGSLGTAYRWMGQFQRALAHLEQALASAHA